MAIKICKKVALVIGGKVLSYSPSMLNFIEFLSTRCKLEIFHSVEIDDNFIIKNPHIKFYNTSRYSDYTLKNFIENLLFYLIYFLRNKLGLDINNRFRQFFYKKNILYFFLHFFKDLMFIFYLKIKHYDIHISIDPDLFVICKKIFPYSKPFYYSLELYLKNDNKRINDLWNQEMKYISDIRGLIIQSEERKKYFLDNYNLDNNLPTFILPVTYKEGSIADKSNYLREKFKIDSAVKILLHLGGIAEENDCLSLIKSIKNIDGWVLILHGYCNEKYLLEIENIIIRDSIKNVFISDEFFENIDDIKVIVKSADAAIAWYKNLSINFYTAGLSSGKISSYFQCGIPVITNDYPSCINAVEKTSAGICISSFNELKNALETIKDGYIFFSENAIKAYDSKYCFDVYKSGLEKFLF